MDNLKEAHDTIKSKGFPYYPKDEKWRNNIYNMLCKFSHLQLLPDGQDHTCAAANLPKNVDKNRFRNIKPCKDITLPIWRNMPNMIYYW